MAPTASVDWTPTIHVFAAGLAVVVHGITAVFHGPAALIGVDELPDGRQIAPQLLVLLGLAIDLFARMENC